MTVKTHTCYTVTCDACDIEPEGDTFQTDHFTSITAALEDARGSDWWATEGLVLCWGDEYDDDHFDRARDHAATLTGDALEEFLEWCPPEWGDQIRPEQARFETHMPGQTTIALVSAAADGQTSDH